MRRHRLHAVIRSGLLVALGGVTLSTPLAQTSLTSTLPACIAAAPPFAWLGLQLHMLSPTANCGDGGFAPGPHYLTAAHATFALSLSTVLVGLIGALIAVGAGVGARRLLGTLRVWLQRHMPARASRSLTLPRRETPVLVPVKARPQRHTSQPQQRRGPPSCSC